MQKDRDSKKSSNTDDDPVRLRNEWLEAADPYLELIEVIKQAVPASSPDREIAENLYYLIKMSSLKDFKEAALLAD